MKVFSFFLICIVSLQIVSGTLRAGNKKGDIKLASLKIEEPDTSINSTLQSNRLLQCQDVWECTIIYGEEYCFWAVKCW